MANSFYEYGLIDELQKIADGEEGSTIGVASITGSGVSGDASPSAQTARTATSPKPIGSLISQTANN